MFRVIFKHNSVIKTHLHRTLTQAVRVRFAPSPTGYLHLGGLRTALYNYLFAKAQNGRFILRIEDTDQSRLVPGAAQQLEDDLRWAGIEIDEGPTFGGDFGPYAQSHRLKIYHDQVKTLLSNGDAYHCFCTERRLELIRREAIKQRQVPKYDNKCRHLSAAEVEERLEKNEPSCIRFKLTKGPETFHDLIYGDITYDVALNEGDPVILKSDGFPTYHFANVVDDHFMKISHVLRGVEWQVSTTKHILMYRAFKWTPPQFGHLPLLLNSDGTKLSKRQNDIKISHYRDSGIFPLALINFIVNSGGGFQKDLERGVKPQCFTLDELAQQFSVETINSHSGKLMPERLQEFNRLELGRKLKNQVETKELVAEVQKIVRKAFPDSLLKVDDEYVEIILKWTLNRIDRLEDLVKNELAFIWVVPRNVEILSEDQLRFVRNFMNVLETIESLEKEKLKSVLKEFAKENNVKYAAFMKTLRGLLSGLKEGPSVAEMIEILGKDNTLKRLEIYVNTKENTINTKVS